jgi:hypothetical protein
VIYYHNASLGLAGDIDTELHKLSSPERYGGIVYRGNVAAVKAPERSVLIEAGFYTSAEDEAIGIEGWGDAIVRGITNNLIEEWGIFPPEQSQEEEDDVVEFIRMQDEPGQGMFAGETVASYKAYGKGTDWLHVSINADGQNKFLLLFNVNYPARRDFQKKEYTDGYYGRVQQLTSYGLNKDEYAWIGIHIPVALENSFMGFIRK